MIDQSQHCNNRSDRWSFYESPIDATTLVGHLLDEYLLPDDDEIETTTEFLIYDGLVRHTDSPGGAGASDGGDDDDDDSDEDNEDDDWEEVVHHEILDEVDGTKERSSLYESKQLMVAKASNYFTR